jgi:hypothetical protein
MLDTLGIDSFNSDFERELERSMARLERRDELLRRRFTIQCELHLLDLRNHHRPLESISKEEAAAVRRESGIKPQDMPTRPLPLPRQNDGWMCLPDY